MDKSTHSGFHSVNWAVYWAFKQSERFAFRKQNLVEESDPSVSVLPPFILTMSLGWVITQSYILCQVNKKWLKASLSDSFTAKNWIECFSMIRMWVSLSRSRFIFQFEAWMMNHRTVQSHWSCGGKGCLWHWAVYKWWGRHWPIFFYGLHILELWNHEYNHELWVLLAVCLW